jgi:hypothetical protein
MITHKSGESLLGARLATKQSPFEVEIASQKTLAITFSERWAITRTKATKKESRWRNAPPDPPDKASACATLVVSSTVLKRSTQ